MRWRLGDVVHGGLVVRYLHREMPNPRQEEPAFKVGWYVSWESPAGRRVGYCRQKPKRELHGLVRKLRMGRARQSSAPERRAKVRAQARARTQWEAMSPLMRNVMAVASSGLSLFCFLKFSPLALGSNHGQA